MTTEVIINAHCSEDTEVKITIGGDGEPQTITLRNGETHTESAYGSKMIIVKEVQK